MALLKTLLDAFEGFSYSLLAFELECHLLHITAQLHEVSVGLDMGFLFFLVTIDPDLASVLLGCNQFALLVNFVEQLLPLDIILLFKGLFLDFKGVGFPLDLCQLLLLLFVLPFVARQERVFLGVGLLDGSILLLDLQ